MAAKKTKSMLDKDGNRKLAAGAGRSKHKSGGEPKRQPEGAPGPGQRTGSSKQRKG